MTANDHLTRPGDVTRLLEAAVAGDAAASDQILPLVYAELRDLARQRLAHERPGQTLQATALVHEAYLRLVASDPDAPWTGRAHFFSAAATAMRRILVERAREKRSLKRGGGGRRVALPESALVSDGPDVDHLALDEALTKLAAIAPRPCEVVCLRYFTGLTIDDAACVLDVSPATVKSDWNYARAWLHRELSVE